MIGWIRPCRRADQGPLNFPGADFWVQNATQETFRTVAVYGIVVEGLFDNRSNPGGVMRRRDMDRRSLGLALTLVLAIDGVTTRAGSPDASSESYFELKVRPVLAGTCVKCHGEQKASGGLRLDSREAILAGGDNGPAIVPGDPQGSLLIQAVRRADETLRMPPTKPLPHDAQDDLAAWVAAGAAWPKATAARPIESQAHWAFGPLRTLTPPED